MRVHIEAKNISIDVMSKRFPDHSWADAMRTCNEQREAKKLNACWDGISIRQWIVDECSANRLIFDTRSPIDRVHRGLRRIVPGYIQKRQPIKIIIQRNEDHQTIESIIANVHRKNMERITELYREAQDTQKRYTSERHRLYETEREIYSVINSLLKLTSQDEYKDEALTEASAVLQARLKSLATHKQAVIDMYESKMSDIEKELSVHSPEIVPGSFIPRTGCREEFWYLSHKQNQ
jgi:hypothetical protein